MNLNRFRRNRHERWQNDLDAYVDGELPAPGALRFEQHLAACDACAALLDLTRGTKAAIVSLPALRAPRSFALTEAMLTATPAPPPPRRAPGMTYRLAQATAFAALAGFATLVVVDVSSGDGGSRDTASAELSTLADEQPVPASGEDSSASSLVPEGAGGGITDDSLGDPADDGGVGAAGSDDGFGYDAGANGDDGQRVDDPEEKIAVPDDGGALEPAPSLEFAAEDEDDGPGGLRIVQVTLGLLALAAAGVWWLLRRQERISW
jgi:hypothetical protein